MYIEKEEVFAKELCVIIIDLMLSFFLGEACGQGSLAHLRDLLELKNISCSCYNIYGDLNDESQTESLSVCASHIVNATQQGQFSGLSVMAIFSVIKYLLFLSMCFMLSFV